MAQKAIGPNFSNELAAAGLSGLPFAWLSGGMITFDPRLTGDQIAQINAVYAAHDPTKPASP